ncbi:MAG TPA: PilZ domain-containing protein [Cellvibrio sp.]|nr:PilZ domain-containing protein [Cellvibrio sp.]
MTHDELRQEYRFNTPLTVFIELIAADDHQPATIVISHCLDISANGLRVIADRELPQGSILQSCIRCNQSGQQFILSTEVKWSRAYQQQGEYLTGLSLFDSENTDIQAWKEFISIHSLKAENE